MFVREPHMSIAEGCYLPRADLFGYVQDKLYQVAFTRPELKPYLPHLPEVDLFATWDEDKFILFVSSGRRGQLPARGMETTHLPKQREQGQDLLGNLRGFENISETPAAQQSFERLGFARGLAVAGTFPAGAYTDEAKAEKSAAAEEVAKLIQDWAEERRREMESSRIFLSHKGVNKPLIDRVDRALRILNLKTWFDQDDLVAGDPLVRGVDNAFVSCGAAVFFISGDYIDAGVIRKEVDRAIHETTTRAEAFRVIPLVLAQHGGTDERVPAPLQTLVWKTVDDVDIVPTILRGLPAFMQAQIKYMQSK